MLTSPAARRVRRRSRRILTLRVRHAAAPFDRIARDDLRDDNPENGLRCTRIDTVAGARPSRGFVVRHDSSVEIKMVRDPSPHGRGGEPEVSARRPIGVGVRSP